MQIILADLLPEKGYPWLSVFSKVVFVYILVAFEFDHKPKSFLMFILWRIDGPIKRQLTSVTMIGLEREI